MSRAESGFSAGWVAELIAREFPRLVGMAELGRTTVARVLSDQDVVR